MSKLLNRVVGEFSRLPGIGSRMALRLALNLLGKDIEDVERLTDAINRFRSDIKFCSRCNNLSDTEMCPICNNPSRDKSMICVVEQVSDLISIENTRQYDGMYHVLGGVISPMQGVAPSDLKIDLLLENIARGEIKEVILAIGATIEGETTLFYILNRIDTRFRNIEITKISRGIGVGDEIEYANEMTIAHAINNRLSVKK